MAAHQQCSLRFFEDGSRLVPIGFPTQPGRSNIRLGNVIDILAEAGVGGVNAGVEDARNAA